MKRLYTCLALLFPLLLQADDHISVSLRGREQTLARILPADGKARAAVIFLPGDGGWRGAAVRIASTIATWGYQVYGLDTRSYLEGSSHRGAKLTREELSEDMRQLAEQIHTLSDKPVLFVGWSQGAGMAIAAIAAGGNPPPAQGVITLGLTETSLLGWDWKAELAVLANRDPGQPSFPVAPLLAHLAPARLWMIYGLHDEYTAPEQERALFRAASEPKRLTEVAGANHRFDGHRNELFGSLKEGLEWIAGD